MAVYYVTSDTTQEFLMDFKDNEKERMGITGHVPAKTGKLNEFSELKLDPKRSQVSFCIRRLNSENCSRRQGKNFLNFLNYYYSSGTLLLQ